MKPKITYKECQQMIAEHRRRVDYLFHPGLYKYNATAVASSITSEVSYGAHNDNEPRGMANWWLSEQSAKFMQWLRSVPGN